MADILLRRLEIGMPLQVDSTLNYLTGAKSPALSLEELAIDSPYNTYRYPGLPPSPIGNPGLSSIKAVLNPQPNPYWYFLTDSGGTVHYGRTFDEHKRNKEQYLP